METYSRKHEKMRRKDNAGLEPNILGNLLLTSKLSTEPKLHRVYTEPAILSNVAEDAGMEGSMPQSMQKRTSGCGRGSSRDNASALPRVLPPLSSALRIPSPQRKTRRHSSSGNAPGSTFRRGSGFANGGSALPEARRAANLVPTRVSQQKPRTAPAPVQQPLKTTRTGLNLLDEATMLQGYIHREIFEGPLVIPQGRGISVDNPQLPAGFLIFSSNFEGGNVAGARRSDDGNEYEVTLRPDSNNPKYRLWFNFSVSNCYQGQQVVFTVTNFSKGRSLYRHGMTPVVRSAKRPTWCRVPARNTYYYKASKSAGNLGYALSWAFVFDDAEDTYEFAYSFPFTYTALQYELGYLDFLDLPYYRRQLLTRSPQMRRVDLLTISQPMFGCPREVFQGSQESAVQPWSRDLASAAASGPGPGSSAAPGFARRGSYQNLGGPAGSGCVEDSSWDSESETTSQASQPASVRGQLEPSPPGLPGPGMRSRRSAATCSSVRLSSVASSPAHMADHAHGLSGGGAHEDPGCLSNAAPGPPRVDASLHRPLTPSFDKSGAQSVPLQHQPELLARAKTAQPAASCVSQQQQKQKASVYGVGFPPLGQAPRKVVVVTGRVHPGETPASYVVQGLINHLMGPDPESVAARSGLTWLIVPMLNPDGCFLGNYRCDSFGVDLNRHWRSPCAPTSPSLHHTLDIIGAYMAHPGFEVALFIDVHAHSTSRHSFLFCNQPSIAAGFSPSTPAYQQGVAYGASAQPNTRPQEQTPSFGSAFLQSIGYSAGPLPSPPLPVGFGSYGWYSQPAAPASLTFGHSSSQAINQQGSDRSGRSSASCQTPSQPLHPLDPQAAVDRVMRLPKLMENMCPGFSAASCVFDGESAKAGSARRVVGSLLPPRALCYTLEVSFFHAASDVTVVTPTGPDDGGNSSNTIEGYLQMGRGLGIAISQLLGALPSPI